MGTRWISSAREVRFADGGCAQLSEMESGILAHLAANAGRVVSRDELLARVWGISAEALETRAVDMHITRLRNKLAGGDAQSGTEWVVTVRGRGYMLGPEVVSSPGPHGSG